MIIKNDDNITQLHLSRWVKKRIKFANLTQIKSIISLLMEEISKDLLSGKELNIFNFGKMWMAPPKPKKYFNVFTQQVEFSNGNFKLKFKIFDKIRYKILEMLDLDKTFESEDDKNAPK